MLSAHLSMEWGKGDSTNRSWEIEKASSRPEYSVCIQYILYIAVKLCRYKCYIMLVCWHSIELSVILQFFSFTWIWDNRKCCEQKHVISAGDVLFDGAQELKARSQPCGLLHSVKASTHRMRRSNSTLSSLHSSNKLIMCLSFYSAVGELVNLH